MVLPTADGTMSTPPGSPSAPSGATAPPGPAAAGDPAVPAGLTDAQREAVTAPDRVLCVLAGAGAGKTRVLTLRVARRVHDGSATGEHVLVCTFSRKAAEELHRRLWVLHVGSEVRAGTFHRTALHLLRQHRADRGLPPPVILPDRRATLATMLGVPSPNGGVAPPSRLPSRSRTRPPAPQAQQVGPARAPGLRAPSAAQLETEIGWAKARLVAPADYEEASRRAGRRPAMGAARIADLYGRYEEVKRGQGLLDLDDLLWSCGDLLEEDARFAAAVRWRFRHLFVDEMQDVNAAQFRLLRALLGDDPDLFVVGDPHQSVYGWNGADPTLLDRLPAILPGTRVVRLDENHRCSPQVVAVAAAALGLPDGGTPTSTRPDGPVPRVVGHATDHDEAAWVAREAWLAHRPGRRWSQIAVLARTNAQLDPLADALRAERVPFRLAGGDLGPASDVRQPAAAGQPDEDEPEDGDPPRHGTGTDDDTADEGVEGDAGRGRWDGGGDRDGTVTGNDAERHGSTDAVVLTTFHRAKGLQWPVVFVVGLSDGLMPISSARTPAARDEERRLLYVALTRAEDELSCSWASHRDARAQEPGAAHRQPSPWLGEVARVRAALEAEAAPPGPDGVAAHLAELRARLG